ncbi:aminotransferase class I/II-fold pyridoxal phosphate-dependent enzyme [Geothermobacter hydrogeniphilus]|nr:aminotransferase class I/II-fold pyridoxal phosphate-dependent enzyme [Geothermobacter hydrogeniphilus]
MTRMARRAASLQPTIFTAMTDLANRHRAVNLGQGFPDFAAGEAIKRSAIRAIEKDCNQYAPGNGQPKLREAIAAKLHRQYRLRFDSKRQIAVTVGATEALFAALFGLLDPGDEVILFEPCYDSYRPAIGMAGGVSRPLTLRPPDWHVDLDELERLISPRTRLLLLNSPQNPIGKVFNREELRAIAELCVRHDVIAVTDEVYEHILFEGEHIPLATLPGMAERTLTISSLAKTFSVTGWKVGWAAGPADLVEALLRVKQFITFCGAAPLQTAAAEALAAGEDFYHRLKEDYRQRRNFLCELLADVGLPPLTPQGTYFVCVDIGDLGRGNDIEFCRDLTERVGVAAIPVSPFCSHPDDGRDLVRFAFCKSWPVLEEAARRLRTGM